MADQFSVGDQALVQVAQDVTNTREQLEGEFQRMRGQLQNVQGAWQGTGAMSFQRAMDAWQNSAHRVSQALVQFADQLRGSQQTYDATEADVTSSLGKYADRLGG